MKKYMDEEEFMGAKSEGKNYIVEESLGGKSGGKCIWLNSLWVKSIWVKDGG